MIDYMTPSPFLSLRLPLEIATLLHDLAYTSGKSKQELVLTAIRQAYLGGVLTPPPTVTPPAAPTPPPVDDDYEETAEEREEREEEAKMLQRLTPEEVEYYREMTRKAGLTPEELQAESDAAWQEIIAKAQRDEDERQKAEVSTLTAPKKAKKLKIKP